MKRAPRYRLVSIIVAIAAAAFVWLVACSNYGEGERCEVLNGNDDCENGLQCLPANQVNQGFSGDRCCPPDRSTATHPACTIQQAPVGGDAGPPPDTGPVPDATVDSPTDTGVESSTDAAVDADDDGG
jgi:hypothetical protein